MKKLHFISGLPRAGSSVISSLLNQNPALASDTNSVLAPALATFNHLWTKTQEIDHDTALQIKKHALVGMLWGYHQRHTQDTLFDRNLNWVPLIPQLEDLLQQEVKILICVRNPAEILSSYERTRANSPLDLSTSDAALVDKTSIAARAYFHAGPEGVLGRTHASIQDAIIMGYLDRMLFVDYGMYCSNPRSQTKRIYDFFEIPDFQHDFNDIPRDNRGVRKKLEKITVNCVQYLGLDLFENYNRNVFWNAWV